MKIQSKILLVDNEPDFIMASQDTLTMSGYQVIIVQNRKNSLEMIAREAPDLVIIGAIEPQGDAYKLNKELRDHPITRNIPILVVDVRPEEHSLKGWRWHEGMQMNADDYLTRPLETTELLCTVKRILDSTNGRKPVDTIQIIKRIEYIMERVEKLEKSLAT